MVTVEQLTSFYGRAITGKALHRSELDSFCWVLSFYKEVIDPVENHLPPSSLPEP
jgi:hypothetical protein